VGGELLKTVALRVHRGRDQVKHQRTRSGNSTSRGRKTRRYLRSIQIADDVEGRVRILVHLEKKVAGRIHVKYLQFSHYIYIIYIYIQIYV